MARKPVTIVGICEESEVGRYVSTMDRDNYVVKSITPCKEKFIIVGELVTFLEEYRKVNEMMISFLRLFADMYMRKDRNAVLSDQVKVYRAAQIVMKELGMSVFEYSDFNEELKEDVTERGLIERFCK